MIMIHRISSVSIVALFLQFLLLGATFGEETETQESHESHDANLLALFVGGALEDRRDNGLALGIEYERRLSPEFGVGALVERTFGDIDVTVYAVPFALHRDRWKFYAAPGIESGDHGSEFLVRVGAEYGFEMEKLEISPQVDVDFVNGERVFVVGVTIGMGF